MVYKYRATQYKIPAQQAGEYLQELGETEGGLTAVKLLDASRPDDALLHGCFEWNDSEAAEKYRLNQAREFIGNIVVVEMEGKPVEKTRAFISVTETAHRSVGVFKPIIEALSDENNRAVVLDNAIREMKTFREKYSNLEELARVISEMDKVIGGAE